MTRPSASEAHTLLLYDGVCGLCNKTVAFLIRHDRHDRLRFASLQSQLGRDLVKKHGANPDELSTIYVVTDYAQPSERVRKRSKAVFFALGELGGLWRVPALLRVFPAFLLDLGYNLVARVRYRVWGRFDACPMPSPETRHKFLGSDTHGSDTHATR